MSEVENRRVLEDLLKQPALSDRGYEIVHYEGPDRRGVDCAFFYNPKFFHLTASKLAPYIYENNDTTYKTRGFLIASGTLAGEKVHFIVNHWPSRLGGEKQSRPKREAAAALTKHIADSVLTADPNSKVIIMGDLNDDPNNTSCKVVLGAKKDQKDVKPGGYYNTMWNFFDKGIGSLAYQGSWNLFDQIII